MQPRCHPWSEPIYIAPSSRTAQKPDWQTARLLRHGSITQAEAFEHLGAASLLPEGWQVQPPQVFESARQSASPLHAMFDAGPLGAVAGGVVLTVPVGVEPLAGRGVPRLPSVPAGAGVGAGVVDGGAPTGRGVFEIGVAVMGGCDTGGGEEAGCGVGVVAGGVATTGVAGVVAAGAGGGGGGGDTAPGPDDDPMSARATQAAAAKRKIERKEVLRMYAIMRLP